MNKVALTKLINGLILSNSSDRNKAVCNQFFISVPDFFSPKEKQLIIDKCQNQWIFISKSKFESKCEVCKIRYFVSDPIFVFTAKPKNYGFHIGCVNLEQLQGTVAYHFYESWKKIQANLRK